MTLEKQLILHEGLRLIVYDDATGQPLKPGKKLVGNPTIGVGRNLSGHGLSDDEVHYLLANDIDRVQDELTRAFSWYRQLSGIRQCVLSDMCFNMGLSKLRTLLFLDDVKCGDYLAAAKRMRTYKWARQVGIRAKRLSFMMAYDRYPIAQELEQW